MTVNIGDNMRGIGNDSFYGCTSIQSVSLGAGLDTIGNYAFSNCAFNKVTIPPLVTTIGDSAFNSSKLFASVTR